MLVRNIAGINRIGDAGTENTGKGLFESIVKFSDAAKEKQGQGAGASDPIVMAVKLGIDLIPEGNFKKWVTMNPLQLYTKLFQAIFGRAWRSDQYRLGERLIDNIDPNGTADTMKSYRDVPDEVVKNAITLFTILFGVRVDSQLDLDALQQGSAAYYLRPDKSDIPAAAVARAVFLKQNFFPDSTYNTTKWDTDIFSRYPLAAPIPDPFQVGKLYSGPLPGGATAKNGVIEIDEVLSTAPGTKPKEDGSNTGMWLLGAGLLGYGLYYYSKKRRRK